MVSIRRRLVRLSAVAVASVLTLLPALGTDARADEVSVTPQTGGLAARATDLVVPAGPVALAIERSHADGGGLLGARWRLNWDSRLVRAGSGLVLRDGDERIEFAAEGGGFRAANGDRLAATANGGFERVRGGLRRDSYDAEGRLVARDLGAGQRAVLRYDAQGRLARIEGPFGAAFAFSHDGAGRLVRVEASTGAVATYAYDGDALATASANGAATGYGYVGERLTRIDDPVSGRLEFGYDGAGRVTGRRWADGAMERWQYDDAQRRTQRIAPDGATTTWAGSADGRRTEETAPDGTRTVTEYDTRGRTVAVAAPDGTTARFSYDALDRIAEVRGADGRTTAMRYVGDSRLVAGITMPDGTRQEFDYDPAGNLLAIRIGGDTIVRMSWTQSGQLASRWAVGTPERRYQYDAAGRLAAEIDSLGQATRYEYDRRGNLTRETNALGGTTVYGYDDRDRLVAETDAAGRTTRFAYDSAGRIVAETAPDGRITRVEYDSRGRRTALVEPGGRRHADTIEEARGIRLTRQADGTAERIRYDAAGRMIEHTDALGRTVRSDYDSDGRLAAEHLPTGQTIRHRYNPAARLAETIDGVGGLVVYGWDRQGMLRSITDATGAMIEFDYDEAGRLAVVADPYGRERRNLYDGYGRLAEVVSPSGDLARYAYDTEGRIVAIAHPDGSSTEFERDAMGNIVAERHPGGGPLRHSYDAAGTRVSTTDAAGRTTRYAYDNAGRLAQKTLPGNRAISYRYDAHDSLAEADDKAFPVQFQRDANGRPTAVIYPTLGKRLTLAHDGFGNRTRLLGAGGAEIQYRYDALRRLSAIVLPDGGAIALAYDVAGRIARIDFPNGVRGEWRYDFVGEVESLRYTAGGNDLASWSYARDRIGNPIGIARTHAPSLELAYDADNRLTSEKSASGWAASYAYNAGGDRASRTARGTTTAYRYNGGVIAEAGAERFAHDVHGNMVRRAGARGETSYEFDDDGRLARATVPGGGRVAFGYAANGDRAWRRDAEGLTYFLHDGVNLVEELAESGATTAFYVHGPGIDWPLAMLRDGQVHYFHADAQGNVALVTDRRGAVAARYDIDAFGAFLAAPPALRNPFVFAGREYDPTLGLYYNRARYYDPDLGRFITADPRFGGIGDPARLNRYVYALNAPTRYRDPLGLAVDARPPSWDLSRNYTLDYDWFESAKGIPRAIVRQLERDIVRNIMQDPNYLPNNKTPLTPLEARSAARYIIERAAAGGPSGKYVGTGAAVEALAERVANPQGTLPRDFLTPPSRSGHPVPAAARPPSPIPSQTANLRGIHGDWMYQPGQRPVYVGDILRERAALGLDPPRPPTGAAPPSGSTSSGSAAAVPGAGPSGTPPTGTPAPSGAGSGTQAVPRPDPPAPSSNTQAVPRPAAGGPRLIPHPDNPGQYIDRANGNVISDNRPGPDAIGRVPTRPSGATLNAAAGEHWVRQPNGQWVVKGTDPNGNAYLRPGPGGTPGQRTDLGPAATRPSGPSSRPGGGSSSGSGSDSGGGGPSIKSVLTGLVTGALVSGGFGYLGCLTRGGSSDQCKQAAVNAAGTGVISGAVTTSIIAGLVKGGYINPATVTRFGPLGTAIGIGAGIGNVIQPITKNWLWRGAQASTSALGQVDLWMVSLLEYRNGINADVAEVRKLLAEAQGLKGELAGQLGRTGTGGAGSTSRAEDEQRRIAELGTLCIEASNAIQAMNEIAIGAMTMAQDVAKILKVETEPPESTPGFGMARQMVLRITELGPRMEAAAQRVPVSVKAVKDRARDLAAGGGGVSKADIAARIDAYNVLTANLQEAANRLRTKIDTFNGMRDQYAAQIATLAASVQSAEQAAFQSRAERITRMEAGNFADLLGDGTNRGAVFEEVSTSDATVARFRNALESAFDKSRDTDVACGPYARPDAVDAAVKVAGANVSDLGDLIAFVNGSLKARTEKLTKMSESDRAILSGAPALIKRFEDAGQKDKVEETKQLVERVQRRAEATPREQSAVREAAQSAERAQQSMGSTMRLLGVGQN